MSELDALRAQIDDIDGELAALFEKRMTVTKKVGEYKKAQGLPVLDAAREKEVLKKKENMLKNPYIRTDIKDFFTAIMAISRRQQRELIADETCRSEWETLKQDIDRARAPVAAPRVLYQGIAGAYADEAASDFFGSTADYGGKSTWIALFEALKEGAADYGVVPIENSSTGSIDAVYDLLSQYGFYVVGEQTVKVEHCLAAPKGATIGGIAKVCSHEQGLRQCGEFIRQHNLKTAVALNTAAAAKEVADSGDCSTAAICSKRAAALYGLEVLEESINTSRDNFTRFFIVSPQLELRDAPNKISLLFTLPNEAGALHNILSIFALHGINLLKLESRPISGKSWEYRFFVDVEGNLKADGMRSIIFELIENTVSLRVLGNYVKGA